MDLQETETTMFVAMNRFRIARGFEAGFEQLWRERDSYLSEVPGFMGSWGWRWRWA